MCILWYQKTPKMLQNQLHQLTYIKGSKKIFSVYFNFKSKK